MEISYLDYLEKYKNDIFQIDDESMINFVITNHCFNSKPLERYVFSVRNREYFIYNDQDESVEVYRTIESFVNEIKNIDTKLTLEEYVKRLLETMRNFIELDAQVKYSTILTNLINRKLKESKNHVISTLYIDDIEEDFVSLLDYKKNLSNNEIKDMDVSLDEFFREIKELNSNIKLDKKESNINGQDRHIIYLDMPTMLTIYRVSGFNKIITNGERLEFNGNIRNELSNESLKELESNGFIYISHIDDKKPSNRKTSLLKLFNNKINIV